MTASTGNTKTKPYRRKGPLQRALPHPLVLLSTTLLVLTFEPFNLAFCAFFALVPFFEVLHRSRSTKESLKHGFWLGWLFSVVTFFWVAYVISQFGQVPWALGVLALLLFGLIGQPQFLIAAPILSWALKRYGTIPRPTWSVLGGGVLIALFYAGLDWSLPKLFVDTLGHAAIEMTRLKQIADLGGPALLTFVMLVANFAIWDTISRLVRRGEPAIFGALRTSLPSLFLSAALIGGGLFYGQSRIDLVASRLAQPKKTIQAAVIQANIGDIDKLSSERGFPGAAQKVMQTFYDMTEEALKHEPRPEVVLWPETSYPSAFRVPDNARDFERDKKLEDFVNEKKITLLFGGYDQRFLTSYNALFYLDQNGSLARYHKTILLMFGEYIPFASTFPIIRSWFPMVAYFGKGPGSVIRDLNGTKTQPVICYEVLFPDFVIPAVREGAELIVNVTNDSWFGPYGAPYHHLNLASFRSIETRTPQIRSTNTGISTLIYPDGSMPNRTQLFVPEILHVQIPIIEPIPTLMLKWGDWFGKSALIFAALVLIALYAREKKQRH